MSRQLLRRDGLRGLFTALFSEDESSGEDAPLEKMDNAAKVLQTIPTGMDPAVSCSSRDHKSPDAENESIGILLHYCASVVIVVIA